MECVRRYGRVFRDMDEVTVELSCYRAARKALWWRMDRNGAELPPAMAASVQGLLAPEEHLLLAISAALPVKVFRISSWTRKRAWAFCHKQWHTQLGAGACGKSTDMGALVYFDFLAHRECTTVKIYSTTKEMLRKRIWKDIVKFHQCYPEDLTYTPTLFSITYGTGDTINGIFGQGVLRDSGELAVSNLLGIHNTRNICVADELQGTPEQVINQTANQRIGGMFQFIGLGNPYDITDTLCKNSVPWDGWEKLPEGAEEWESRVGVQKRGYVLRFDGEKSPRITEPNGEELYPFLIGQKDIDDLKDQFGPDSPEYWTQARGQPKLRGAYNTFLDAELIESQDMTGRHVFVSTPRVFAGFDPAFTAGGDRPFLSFAAVGLTSDGLIGIQFQDEVSFKIQPAPGETVTDFLARRVREECRKRGVDGATFGMDTTGQDTLADVFSSVHNLGPGIYRISFAEMASEEQVSMKDKRPGRKAFKNRVTELWHGMSLFGRFGHVRGLSMDAISEFVARKWYIQPDGRRMAEKKEVVRGRLGRSPDNADSKVILLATVRAKMKLIPGARKSKGDNQYALALRALLPHNRRPDKAAPAPFSSYALIPRTR